jgi:glucose/arabinose dehydrogenase
MRRYLLGVTILMLLAVAACSGGSSADPTAADPTGQGSGQTVVDLQLVAEGLTAPLALITPGDGSGRLLVADQIGLIRVISASGELLSRPFLDLRDRMVTLQSGYDERGLLGLAVHPDYAKNGRLFVYYSAPLRAGAPAGWNHTSHISEFHVSSTDPNQADPTSERIILQVDEPEANPIPSPRTTPSWVAQAGTRSLPTGCAILTTSLSTPVESTRCTPGMPARTAGKRWTWS